MKSFIIAAVTFAVLASAACTANPPEPEEISVPNTGNSQEFLDQWEDALIHPTPDNSPKTLEDLLIPDADK